MRLHRFSDPDRPLGNVHNTQRLLRTQLPLAALLVRETVQNSWDARAHEPHSDRQPVHYAVHGWNLEGAPLEALRTLLHDLPPDGLPPGASSGSTPAQVLGEPRIPVLAVSDWGTVGLNGPDRSDVTRPGERRFIRFLLDMGRESGQDLAGGTYGYGKTVLWRASLCSLVITYSRYRTNGRLRSRLMGAALGDPYVDSGRRYTGRHWWGRSDADVGVLPLEDGAAEEVARAVGIPTAPEGETGTSVLVVGTRLGGRKGVEALREAARWHCWPKLVPLETGPDMAFEFLWNHTPLPAIDPVSDPELAPLASSLMKVLDQEGEPCEVHRPRVVAGHFAYDLAPRRPGPVMASEAESVYDDHDEDDVAALRPVAGELNHVALIRGGPRLLVRYEALPGSPPDPSLRAGGVFISSDRQTRSGTSVETAFAISEPPTHDDWSWRDLDRGEEKTIVRTGMRRLHEVMQKHLSPKSPVGSATALVGLSRMLGDLIPEGAGPGWEPQPTRGRTSPSRRRLTVHERASFLTAWNGRRWGGLEFDLRGGNDEDVVLNAAVSILDADGFSTPLEPDDLVGDVYWQAEEGSAQPGWSLSLPPDRPRQGWTLWVPIESERRLRIGVRIGAADA